MSELEKYIKIVEKEMKALKELECKDRTDYHAGLETCNEQINASTLGWAKWLSKATTMKNFTDVELKEYFNKMRDLALSFLQLDVEATKLFVEKAEKKEKEILKKDAQEKISGYVA